MRKRKIINDYKENKKFRNSFNKLANLVFKIDFEKWYQKGFWDKRYKCYSIIENNAVISNVSITEMDIILNGNIQKAIQFGTVMTHPEFRGQGLAGQLMKTVIEEYEKKVDFFYLFPNNSVLDFYPKYGFIRSYDIYYSKALFFLK